MSRTILGVLLAAVAVFVVAALLTGDAIWVVPVLILLAVVAVAAAGHLGLRKRVEQTGGDTALPAAHVEHDEQTALGDTPEAHDELSPHDLPVDHPGRQAAERQAG
jgi:hypothetical protein